MTTTPDNAYGPVPYPDPLALKSNEVLGPTSPELAAVADLVAVLCDPEGKAAIRGSDGDLAIIDAALTTLRFAMDDCQQYLKEGETLAQRIERERRDTGAVLKLLAREKQKTERMSELLHRMLEAPMTHVRDSWKAEARYALVRSDCLADAPERCPHCDDTGDIHTPTGEWRGVCGCDKAARVRAIVDAGPFPGMSEAFDAHMGAACWTDPAYAPDASMWAAAWKAAKRMGPNAKLT